MRSIDIAISIWDIIFYNFVSEIMSNFFNLLYIFWLTFSFISFGSVKCIKCMRPNLLSYCYSWSFFTLSLFLPTFSSKHIQKESVCQCRVPMSPLNLVWQHEIYTRIVIHKILTKFEKWLRFLGSYEHLKLKLPTFVSKLPTWCRKNMKSLCNY